MKLHLFAFGKLRTPGLREAADYYQKVIQPWVPLEEVELKPVPVPSKSASVRTQVQEKETLLLREKLANRLSSRGIYYLLDESGKAMNTRSWAFWVMKERSLRTSDRLRFV